MRSLKLMLGLLLCGAATAALIAQEPPWNPNAIKECDRACLVGVIDGYMNAIFKHDPKAVPPASIDVRMTENTGQMDIGEGMLCRTLGLFERLCFTKARVHTKDTSIFSKNKNRDLRVHFVSS